MMELRPYQLDVIAECHRVIAAGHKRPLIVAPTAAGKTVIAAAIIQDALAKQMSVLVLAHTREIIKQTAAKIVRAQHRARHHPGRLHDEPDEPVQIASIQTLWTRAMRTRRMELPPADLLIIDEAHHCPATTYRKLIGA